jgi:hypothetical protein
MSDRFEDGGAVSQAVGFQRLLGIPDPPLVLPMSNVPGAERAPVIGEISCFSPHPFDVILIQRPWAAPVPRW